MVLQLICQPCSCLIRRALLSIRHADEQRRRSLGFYHPPHLVHKFRATMDAFNFFNRRTPCLGTVFHSGRNWNHRRTPKVTGDGRTLPHSLPSAILLNGTEAPAFGVLADAGGRFARHTGRRGGGDSLCAGAPAESRSHIATLQGARELHLVLRKPPVPRISYRDCADTWMRVDNCLAFREIRVRIRAVGIHEVREP